MRRKSLIASVLTASIAMSLAACGGNNAAGTTAANTSAADTKAAESQVDGDKGEASAVTGTKQGQTVLKCAFNQSAENPEAETVRQMSDKLYDATEGRYSIEVYPNELLGNQQDSLQSVEVGAVDMSIVANSIIEGVNADFSVIGCPYIYDSIDQQQRLFESGALDELYKTTESAGFRVLAAYSFGPRNLYTRDGAVTTPEELKGKKIRVMQSDTMIQMMNNMGGVGTPMSQGDVYSAIQTGTLDGAENNIITYMDLKQYEVAPYYSLTGHLMVPDEVVISSDVFNSMSPEDQEALQKVADESVTTCFDLCAKLRDQYVADAKDKGVTITEVDITPFQEANKALIEASANKSDITKAIYAKLQELK